jgi:predicted ATPase/DNA-binding CsgD family transcriptional regulator
MIALPQRNTNDEVGDHMAGSDQTSTQRPADAGVAAELEAEGLDDATEIGRGGFGIVYRCRQPSLDRTVAVKVLTTDLDGDSLDRFLREQRAMGRLSGHPNIVNVLQVGVTATGRPYLVMQYHPQDSLDARIRGSGPLSLGEALRIGVKLAGAVETAHRAGILHRDIKPANILLTEYGEPELGDFGIARISGGFETTAGSITASPAFTAPELLRGDPPSVASDVYGLGATLFCAITGHAAFERRSGERLVAQFVRITTDPVPDLRRDGLPDDVCALLERAMAHLPADRPASVAEFGEQLRKAQRDNGFSVDHMALSGQATTEPAREIGPGAAIRPPALITSFVGRRRELAEAKRAMTESRLVTLTGPGGVGKTRIAYELAERLRRAFRDGSWVVELASVEDESGLASIVVSSLAVADQSNRAPIRKLVEHLRERQLLIVLDNCEHLLAPVADLVDAMLAESPGLRILATSREPLGVAGERICTVPPLTTPPVDQPLTPERVDQYEAVRLLVDRARDITPDFAVTQENSDAVVQLCNRLDGIPLAIELAATRLRALSLTQIVERLDRRFSLLTGGSRVAVPRQQTLRALIDWSYELCTEPEKLLWARLSVFTGSFDLNAAEQVCGFGDLLSDDVFDVLDRLVAKSILVIDRDGELVRYRMLMTVREYGAELLERAGEYGSVRRRHRDHYRRNAIRMVQRWCGPGQADALAALRRDHSNLMSALEWSVTTPGELDDGAELAAFLRYHWIAGGFLGDGRRWLEQILTAMDPSSPRRGETLWVAAWVALIQGDRDPAARWLAEGGEIARANDDGRLAAHVAQWTAIHRLFSGDLSEAIVLFERSIDGHVACDDRASQLTGLFQLAMAQTYAGRHEDALRTCARALELSGQRGERWTHAYSLWIRGVTRWHLGDLDGAERDARAALLLQRDFKDSICTALTIELVSWVALSRSNDERAAELLGAATAVWTALGTTVDAFGPHIHRDSVESTDKVARVLGRKRFAELSSRHVRLGKDEAIDLALGGGRSAQARPAKSPLTKREREIAALIAQGMSNRAVAESLVISPRTVDGHVERILAKLDFTSRAQIAAWVASSHADPESG